MKIFDLKPGDYLNIMNNVVIKLIAIKKDKAKLGVNAPKNTTVLRGELIAQKKKEETEIT